MTQQRANKVEQKNRICKNYGSMRERGNHCHQPSSPSVGAAETVLGVGEGISLISAACGRGVVAGVCIELRVLEGVGGETERLGVSGGLCGLCPRIEPCAVGDAGTAMEIGRAAGSRVRVARPSTARCAEENVLCDIACERVRVWRCFTSLSLGDGGRAIREGRTDA